MIETIYTFNCDDFVSSTHMRKFLQPTVLAKHLTLARRALARHKFDTIAFRGMSGAFVGPIMSVRMGKNMILVRKEKDDTHSSYGVEGYKKAQRYVIVDDFISSGLTKDTIIDEISRFAAQAECIGLLEVARIDTGLLKLRESRKSPYPLS